MRFERAASAAVVSARTNVRWPWVSCWTILSRQIAAITDGVVPQHGIHNGAGQAQGGKGHQRNRDDAGEHDKHLLGSLPDRRCRDGHPDIPSNSLSQVLTRIGSEAVNGRLEID